MATTPVHRCFACPLPHHATFWTTDPTTTSDDLLNLLTRHGLPVLSLRPANPDERARYLGTEVDPDRTVWITLQADVPTLAP